MSIGRRAFLRWVAATAAAVASTAVWTKRGVAGIFFGPTYAARAAKLGDGTALRAIMTSCVSDASSFFGKCGDWPLSWAEKFVDERPASVVVTKDGAPIAFHEVPPLPPPLPALAVNATAQDIDLYQRRDKRRRTFRVMAAGIRDDLLGPDEAVSTFRTVIYEAYKVAFAMGYEYAEAFAPWEKHPKMPRKWTDYPGCELVEPPRKAQGDGPDFYWLRWRLADAIRALEAEGAGVDKL